MLKLLASARLYGFGPRHCTAAAARRMSNASTGMRGTPPLPHYPRQRLLPSISLPRAFTTSSSNSGVGGGTTDDELNDLSAAMLFIAARDGDCTTVKTILNEGTATHVCTPPRTFYLLCIYFLYAMLCLIFFLRNNGITNIYARPHPHHPHTTGGDANIALPEHNNLTPLFVSANQGHANVVQVLLEHGADVNQPVTDIGVTPLYIACDQGHTEVVRTLLAAAAAGGDGIRVNLARTDVGATPLYIAAQKGHVGIVTMLLLEGNADPNAARTDNGITPLCIAAEKGYDTVVGVLLGTALSHRHL